MANEKIVTRPSIRTTETSSPSTKAYNATEQPPVTLSDTLLGTDPPIEEAHPGLQPALVFASYPIVLIVVISIAAVYFFFFRSIPSSDKVAPVQVESKK